jgi:hypothetical protein
MAQLCSLQASDFYTGLFAPRGFSHGGIRFETDFLRFPGAMDGLAHYNSTSLF